MIILRFDNVHLRRDNIKVPSDIEQIPALYNSMRDNGTRLANDHTVLISHTSDGILSTATGLYPSDFGGAVGNTFPFLDSAQTKTKGIDTYGEFPDERHLALHLLDRPDRPHRGPAVHADHHSPARRIRTA